MSADGAVVRSGRGGGARTVLLCWETSGMRGPDLGSARDLELVGGTDLTIRRIKRTHELGRLITASETKESIRSAPIFACTCMRAKD